MSLDTLREAANAALTPPAWAYYQGTAGSPELDAQAWSSVLLVPRVLTGLTGIDTSTTLGGARLDTPVLIAATAAHRLAHPDGELATARAAAAEGALMVYSSSAAVEVTEFGAGATGPWWAQVYVMRDRGVTNDYLDRCVAAGAGALVLTVDYPGAIAKAGFRTATEGRLDATPGNYPQWTWPEMSAAIQPGLTPGRHRRTDRAHRPPRARQGRAASAGRQHGGGRRRGRHRGVQSRPPAGGRCAADGLRPAVRGGRRRGRRDRHRGRRDPDRGGRAARARAWARPGSASAGRCCGGWPRPAPRASARSSAPSPRELRQAMASVGAGTVADLDHDHVRRPQY